MMISLPSFQALNHSFINYLDSFPVKSNEILDHFQIKKSHTYRVVSNIREIAVRSGLPESETGLATIIALFHDMGRFEQFTTYRTFDDSISENHAAITLRVLQQQNFLAGFDDTTKEIIIQSIENHNIPVLPEIKDAAVLLFSKLLRDADKLDIWRLTLEQNVVFTIRESREQDSYSIPENILKSIREGRVVLLQYADSMNDFRLLRLSWIVDMNFPATFSIIQEKGYIDKILSKIPDFPEKAEITAILHQHCRRKCEDNAAGGHRQAIRK